MSGGAARAVAALTFGLASASALTQGSGAIVYRCPGPPVIYTDKISPEEAQQRACWKIEGVGTRPSASSAPKFSDAQHAAAARKAREFVAAYMRAHSLNDASLQRALGVSRSDLTAWVGVYILTNPPEADPAGIIRAIERVKQIGDDIKRGAN